MAQRPNRSDPDLNRPQEDLEQVREILIGQQMRSLAAQLHELSQELVRTKDDLEQQIQNAQAHMAAENQTMRVTLSAADANLQQQVDELRRALADHNQGLRRTMTGRSDLAKMLQDVAAQLADTPPTADDVAGR